MIKAQDIISKNNIKIKKNNNKVNIANNGKKKNIEEQ